METTSEASDDQSSRSAESASEESSQSAEAERQLAEEHLFEA